MHSGGQEFDPPRLHHSCPQAQRSGRPVKSHPIDQMVRLFEQHPARVAHVKRPIGSCGNRLIALISFREKNQQHCWYSRVWERPQIGAKRAWPWTAPGSVMFPQTVPDVCLPETTELSKSSTLTRMISADHAQVLQPSPETDIACKEGKSGKVMHFWFRNRDLLLTSCQVAIAPAGCLFLDQIKREKGVWWMPWQ